MRCPRAATRAARRTATPPARAPRIVRRGFASAATSSVATCRSRSPRVSSMTRSASVAEPEAAIEMDAAAGGLADRHPFEIRRDTPRPGAWPSRPRPVGVVVGGAAAPRVVGQLVVVPDDDERMPPVRLLQVGIAAIGRVADAVVAQRDRFAARLRDAQQPAAVAVDAVLRTRRCSRRGAPRRRDRRGWRGSDRR